MHCKYTHSQSDIKTNQGVNHPIQAKELIENLLNKSKKYLDKGLTIEGPGNHSSVESCLEIAKNFKSKTPYEVALTLYQLHNMHQKKILEHLRVIDYYFTVDIKNQLFILEYLNDIYSNFESLYDELGVDTLIISFLGMDPRLQGIVEKLLLAFPEKTPFEKFKVKESKKDYNSSEVECAQIELKKQLVAYSRSCYCY